MKSAANLILKLLGVLLLTTAVLKGGKFVAAESSQGIFSDKVFL